MSGCVCVCVSERGDYSFQTGAIVHMVSSGDSEFFSEFFDAITASCSMLLQRFTAIIRDLLDAYWNFL